MDRVTFMKHYLESFERETMLSLLDKPSRAFLPKESVPVRVRRIHRTTFGSFVGRTFEFDGELAFNFYGLYKMSTGLRALYEENKAKFPGIKLIQAPVINFAAILPKEVKIISPDLYPYFSDFKKFFVLLRWK